MPLIKLFVCPFSSTDGTGALGHEVTELTKWRPTSDDLDILKEGHCFYATNLAVRSAATHRNSFSSTKSTAVRLKRQQQPFGKLPYFPRRPLRVQELRKFSLNTPFDMVVVIMCVSPCGIFGSPFLISHTVVDSAPSDWNLKRNLRVCQTCLCLSCILRSSISLSKMLREHTVESFSKVALRTSRFRGA